MIDTLRLLQNLNIPYISEGKNVSRGWVGISCPLCHDHSNNGGFNLEKGYYSCWRCGYHPLTKIVGALAHINEKQARLIIKQYNTPYHHSPPILKTPPRGVQPPLNSLNLPGTTLTNHHCQYLIQRGFHPQQLTSTYALTGTGPIGAYKHRIIIPIIQNGIIVSYQGRDITGKASLRYKPCRKENEIIPHKHCLYNIDSCSDTAVIVEGITDVWRLGPGAIATFGIIFTEEQIKTILSKKIKKAFILFDNEPQAQRQAQKLAYELSSFGVLTEVITLNNVKDPAELTWENAARLMSSLIHQ